MPWRRKWQPTPAFLPGESQGQGSLVGCRLWGRTESDTTEVIYLAAAAATCIYVYVCLYVCGASIWWLSDKESACQCKRCRFSPWVRKIFWRRKWPPTPVFLPGKSHGQRSLVGYSPCGPKRVRHNLDTKQQQCMYVYLVTYLSLCGITHTHTHIYIVQYLL